MHSAQLQLQAPLKTPQTRAPRTASAARSTRSKHHGTASICSLMPPAPQLAARALKGCTLPAPRAAKKERQTPHILNTRNLLGCSNPSPKNIFRQKPV